ncbi:hypothetical protein [Natronolimnohabitans innermongolicus]|uniref:Membrane-bound metal-dependent hydrolase n=1 Tax=Natronolimnohabitans innermongolicus JCM 12255 TaxID=1227499 RepID=L9XDW7_9EURY|nr:hypothetical protein [Natronolimnohabitans innermongolicus]ELY59914.1 hypothetical protein C493_04778 [Natronolimnohabitans innermongolicus JCM 12255]
MVVAGDAIPAPALVGVATAAGVLIDLDHFLIARVRTGSWDAVRFCLTNPTAAVADQRRIFERGDVGVLSRLLSHLVIIGLVVPAAALWSVPLAALVGGVLYAHLVSDVAWDIWRLEQYADVPREELLQVLR